MEGEWRGGLGEVGVLPARWSRNHRRRFGAEAWQIMSWRERSGLATGNVTSSPPITRLHGQAAVRGPARRWLPPEAQTPKTDRSTRIFEKLRRALWVRELAALPAARNVT